jgi:ATP-dependent exoDNAse (exonuclease V) beta subunit
VLDWVNQTFPVVMPPEDNPLTGAVSYGAASTRPGVSKEGAVTIQILPEYDDEQEARQVIECITQCAEEESVAILVRARHHAGSILAQLDKLKTEQPRFRYQAINFTRLSDTTLVMDLVSLTLALLQPADRLAWLCVLRSPCVGLALADLDTLVAGDPQNIILDALSTGSGITDDGRQRLRRVGPLLLQAVKRSGRQSIRSLVETTWLKLGGPACLANASEMDDAATYFELLDSMEEEGLPIDRDSLDQGLENLYAQPDADANGKLQVLTIYEAKGLQFDTVILPGLNRRPGGDNNKLLHWFELAGEDRIVMSPMRNSEEKQSKSGDLIKFITRIEKQRQSLEDGRLLYVAATRAKQKLHLFAAIKPDANDIIKPDAASMMANLWPAIQERQAPLVRQAAAARADNGDAETESTTVALPQLYTRLPCRWRLPDPPPAVELPASTTGEIQDYIEFNWAGEDARLTGNLVHRLLQVIGERGLADWTSANGMQTADLWCRHYLRQHGAQGKKARAIIDMTVSAIETCLASSRGRWILSDHREARCEHRLTAMLAGRTRNLVLDRTFVDNGTRWIIDYKTSTHSGGGLEGFLANEADRYREQLQGYRDAMALSETRPIKTALYFPLLDRFVEVT